MLSDELVEDLAPDLDTDSSSLNDTLGSESSHDKRQAQFHVPRDTPFWGPSQVSLPKDSSWGSKGSSSFDPENPNGDTYTYNYDVASAQDTYVYMINDEGIWNDHIVCTLSHIPF